MTSKHQFKRTSFEPLVGQVATTVLDGNRLDGVSCSDAAIAPLVSSSSRQLTGLIPALPARSRSTDIRGNMTENEMLIDSSLVTSRQTVPHAANKLLSISRYGVSLMDVSVSAVTNTVTCDSLGRQIAHTDGRGNTRQTEYNSFGQRFASIDAIGNRTIYAYDQFGNLSSVTDPLGNAIIYEYDLRGRKTYEGGATYPVDYSYDQFGEKIAMTTYRDLNSSGDTTLWMLDEATGLVTNKVYADGLGPTYTYTPDGKLASRTWARGIVTTYSYDDNGSLTNTIYSDSTPTITLAYNRAGRQIRAEDAAGVTTFAYDQYGTITNETVIGVAGTNVIERYWDVYGRSLGYSLNGTRQSTVGYDSVGRISSMLTDGCDTPFTWSYLPGSDLKSSLAYPNGLTASWQYDANGQLLQVKNAFPTNIVSQYDYTYDAAGRRTERYHSGSAFATPDQIYYDYNERSELTNAVASIDSAYSFAYNYDDIGNRLWSVENTNETAYMANNLNQYTTIEEDADTFVPQFDDDGNQTFIKTATGLWQVSYNGENRPVLWECGSTNITMQFDRMGRRVEYIETVSGVTNIHHRFVYDGYLCIQRLNALSNNAIDLVFGWDPSEQVATRPLVLQKYGQYSMFYTHDGNKNVSDLVFFQQANGIAAHYEYAPFGAVTATSSSTPVMAYDFREYNPFRFSSEYADDALGLEYYNYRHYNPGDGRWTSRDVLDEDGGENLYAFCGNNSICNHDKDGCAYFIKRSMFRLMYRTAQRDIDNQEWAHEQLIFEDNKEPKDVGYFNDGKVREDPGWAASATVVRVPGRYNDCVMRKAVQSVRPRPYKMLGQGHYNCQDYADDLRARYGVLIRDEKVRCECGLSK